MAGISRHDRGLADNIDQVSGVKAQKKLLLRCGGEIGNIRRRSMRPSCREGGESGPPQGGYYFLVGAPRD